MDYRTELMKTQCPVKSKGPNDPHRSLHPLVAIKARSVWSERGELEEDKDLDGPLVCAPSIGGRLRCRAQLWNPFIAPHDCSLI